MRVDFWTNVEYTAYLRALAQELQGEGIELRPRFDLTQAQYLAARGRAGRLAFRFRAYVRYPLRLIADFLLRREPRLAIVTSNTFFVPWLAARLGGRRRRIIHLVYDLYPETLVQAGIIRAGGMAERILGRIVRDTFRRSAANVMLGARLAEHVRRRHGEAASPPGRLRIIPVGAVAVRGPADDAEDSPPTTSRGPQDRGKKAKVAILYCGNMGHLHDVETVAQYLKGTEDDGVDWRFQATGAGYERFKAELGNPRRSGLHLGASLGDEEWAAAMRSAAVALVTMREGAEKILMPSKTYSALRAGQAILAVCPQESDLADLVRRHDCGWVVEPGDVAGFARAVREIATGPAALARRRRNASMAGESEYSIAAVGRQWAGLLREIGG